MKCSTDSLAAQVISIHAQVERYARNTPDAVALVSTAGSLNYLDLDTRAESLAQELRALGVTTGQMIGVHIPRSIDLIVAVLAVWKAGACCVALAVEQPVSRIAQMLVDARVTMVMTNGDSALEGVDVVDVRRIPPARAASARAAPIAFRPAPGDLAYCIFTSGSTGNPKPVLITYAGFSSLRDSQLASYGICASDRVLQFASFGFDVFIYDLMQSFGFGGVLVLRDEAVDSRMIDLMDRFAVTVATLPPALLARLDLRKLTNLRMVTSAGDRCSAAALQMLPQGCALFNAYGPTEVTIWSMVYRVPANHPAEATVPLGGPIKGLSLYVLDGRLEPVAPGQPGELFIAGEALGLGYAWLAGHTAERFIPCPFGGPGRRMYCTGDVVQARADGALEFIGRIDDQVKIRGYRVELGEVERALNQCEGVLEASVIATLPGTADRRLVAFVVPKDGALLAPSALAAQMATRLPAGMVPELWHLVSELPLNSSGKVDRRALGLLEMQAPTPREVLRAPQTEMEGKVAEAWSAVLKLGSFDLEDGFRTLGGSSIQAVDVAFRLSAVLPWLGSIPAPRGNVSAVSYAALLEAIGPEVALPTELASVADVNGPAAFSQRQVAFLEELGDAWRAYRTHARLDFAGKLDIEALHAAMQSLVDRHEILRTSFGLKRGVLHRDVAEYVEVPLHRVDLSTIADSSRRTSALQAFMLEELGRKMDSTRAPLVRWTLVRMTKLEHVLLVSEHHFVHDGQSFRILLADMAHAYEAHLHKRPIELPPLEAQYSAYCVDEARWLASADYRRALDAWNAHLEHQPRDGRMFANAGTALERRFVGGQVRVPIDLELFQRSGELAARIAVTRYSLMLTAFSLHCARLSGKRKFMVGSALANRTSPRFQRTVGMFVNMLPIAVDFARHPSFIDAVRDVAANVDFAVANCRVPLASLVRELGVSESFQGDAPFDTTFSFHDTIKAETRFSDLDVHIEEALSNGSSKFELSIIGLLGNPSSRHPLELLFEFNSDRFERREIEELSAGYVDLLRAIVEDPSLFVLEPFSPQQDDQRQDTGVKFDESGCIHQLFEARALETPDAVALAMDDTTATYREVDERSNQLAQHLLAQGVGRGDLVAVCMERSLEMPLALLAILKAGAAYVPVDPDYPAQRIGYMLDDCGAKRLISQERFRELLGDRAAQTLFIDAPAETSAIARCSPQRPAVAEAADEPAYCIYTSGSTGGPKGALNSHRAVVNRLLWMKRQSGLGVADVVLQKTPFAFDVSVWEFFLPLISGARLVMAAPGGHRDPGYLGDAIRRHAVTTIHFVPSMLSTFLSSHERGRIDSVKRVYCSGEALALALQKRFHREMPEIELHNLYGPTEAAVDVTHWHSRPDHAGGTVPIGRPIANTQIYLLDDALEEVAQDAQGEIFIGGIQPALGYLGRSGLTAEKFLPDPFKGVGTRMYRTGDLARRNADGEIEFLGRFDDQVKIRGFRIELGEVEEALLACPGVAAAAVACQQESGRESRLLAYVCPTSPGAAIEARAMQHLRKTLPEHMLPAEWVTLESLPLSPNGKIDRRALPKPATRAKDTPRQESCAEDDNELRLVLELVGELLPGTAIGAYDDVFAKGMHSIALMQLIELCRERTGVRMKLREVFKLATPASIASHLRRNLEAVL